MAQDPRIKFPFPESTRLLAYRYPGDGGRGEMWSSMLVRWVGWNRRLRDGPCLWLMPYYLGLAGVTAVTQLGARAVSRAWGFLSLVSQSVL